MVRIEVTWDMADESDQPPISKLTRSKQRWARLTLRNPSIQLVLRETPWMTSNAFSILVTVSSDKRVKALS
jgi:hypothetical protein